MGQIAVHVFGWRTGQNFTHIIGLLKLQIFDGSVTSELFNNFIINLAILKAQNCCLIFNNALSHRFANHLNLQNGHVIEFLQLYSPF